ncbi:melanoma antigen preferentially expressed in tumors [Mirounga leonina]|uniref:melanoma antigen preferentially expressed in tumors n=1 Tax=Mirounga leonina TaxID=9715 RepID=UPI00156BFAA4|nr:melanoma antigen preferentially expressed in tumors [Mirounga leonina]
MTLSTPTGRSALRLLPPPLSSRTCWKSRRQNRCAQFQRTASTSPRTRGNPHRPFSLGGLFGFFHLSGFSSYILQRVEKSHGCLRLRCRTVVINQVPFRSLVEILGMLELETIQEVRLHHRSRFCFQSDLIQFFTHVGQMSSLGHLVMNDIPWDFPADCFSLLSLLGHLQKLHLIFGCLSDQMPSGLRKPLEMLVINGCRLTENDITYLSQSVHATHLKELVLCGNNLSQMVPGPLEVLLGEVSGTLQHLNLNLEKMF